jgi:hypothetical protein
MTEWIEEQKKKKKCGRQKSNSKGREDKSWDESSGVYTEKSRGGKE